MLPAKYAYLNRLGLLPRVISEGLKEFGVVETPGAANNPKIMAWADEIGEDAIGWKYTADSIPWCGLFVGVVAQRAGKQLPAGPLYALNWSTFGTPVAVRSGLALTKALAFDPGLHASLGDVLVFRREGGGHVGFYVGESDNTYHVLGGNQSDKVCIVEVAKKRCVAVRRPAMSVPPKSMKPYFISASGKLSVNEA